jgi:hypothetical protein
VLDLDVNHDADGPGNFARFGDPDHAAAYRAEAQVKAIQAWPPR